MPRFALLLAYHGGEFCGWQQQPGRRSVAGCLDSALQRLHEPDCGLRGAARTDAGVHARGQIAQLDCQRHWSAGELAAALNQQLPEDCVCRAAAELDPQMDLLAHSLGKHYRYRWDIGAIRNPFLASNAWRAPGCPDLDSLRRVSQLFLGPQDLQAFRRRGDERADYHCTIQRIDWQDSGPERSCDILGNRFTYRLVRSLMACIWELARGSLSLQEARDCLAGQRNACCQQQAPAKGLCLESVLLDQELQWVQPSMATGEDES